MIKSGKVYVVGIGASAGGLEAIGQLIGSLTLEAPCAYVVLQHLSPKHRSMMVEILGRETMLDVKEAAQGDLLQAGVIYVVPSNYNAIYRDGRLHLLVAPPEVVPKPSVNEFFISLAAEEGESAIGILLSGTGSDGVAGLRAIQAAGGFTIAQRPDTAKYDGMPRSAIEAGVVDHVLAPEEMPAKLLNLLNMPITDESTGYSKLVEELLQRLRTTLKFDFSGYKTGTLMRRIHRRLVATGSSDLAAYLDWITANPRELELLARDILISVTAFFRDREAFEALRRVIQSLCQQRAQGSEIRIWVAGCASGEEAYSIAMILADALGDHLPAYRIQIFATDVDEEALNVARRGIYPAAAMSEIPVDLLQRFFHPVKADYEAGKLLRDMIVFARHNLVSDPPFLRLDLVSCRNVLIYFDAPLQAKVLKTFHFSLVREGCLFLGRSESIAQAEQLFSPLDRKERVFLKVGESASVPPAMGMPVRTPMQRKERKTELLLGVMTEHFGVTAALCDSEGKVQHTLGDVKRFLEFPEGDTRITITDIVKAPLRGELVTLLHRCTQTGKPQRGRRRKLDRHGLRMFVTPLSDGGVPLHVVLLVPERAKEAHEKTNEPSLAAPGHELENELVTTREHLQTLVQEMATANEEMQALHEEAQASNEELQATNEELEAANEELQASNQELVSLNEELNIKTGELYQLNEEYSHLYDALDYPVLVFDQASHLLRFNAAAGRRFDLRLSALRQPINRLRLPPGLKDLESLLGRVRAHGDLETTSLTLDSRNFRLAVNPGLDKNGTVVTLVVTLLDITDMVTAQESLQESQNRLALLMDRTRVIFAMKDLSGQYTFVNRRFAEFFGLEPEACLGKSSFAVLPQALAADLWALDLAALREGELVQGETRFICNGRRCGLRSSHQILKDTHGQPVGFIFEAEDVSLTMLAEEQLRITARVFDQTGEAIVVSNSQGIIQTVNAAFTRITGYSTDEAVGQPTTLLKSGRHSKEFYVDMWRDLDTHGSWQGEIWNRRKNGEIFPEWLTINRVDNHQGEVEHYVAVFSDISSIKNAQRRAEFLSTHDPLTGLPNRNLFNDRLRQNLAAARRNNSRVGLFFVDLDNFKTINDTLGHDVGDELLKQAAQRLREVVRDVDTVARIGGDEFTAILADANDEAAEKVGSRLIDELSTSFHIADRDLFVTASVGVAFFPEDGDNSTTLIKAADTAMYRAKEQGRNRIEYFKADLQVRLHKKAALESALRLAIREDRLRLAYQPKYGLGPGQPLLGAEALLRWNDPELGPVSPAMFIPVAESSGLILELSQRVENLFCRQIQLWRQAGLDPPVIALNLSPRSLRERNFVPGFLSLLSLYEVPVTGVILEITENALLENTAQVEENINLLHEAGLSFSIDDFGTGYSSLGYLKRMPISELKIDKSFVDGLGQDLEDEAIAKAIMGLAKALDLNIVAEGVENEIQLNWLLANGCNIAQGYHFSYPLEAEEFTQLLTEIRSSTQPLAGSAQAVGTKRREGTDG